MNFLTRTGLVQHWTDFCGRLTLQGLQTGSLAAAENVRSAQETCKCLCKWRPFCAQTVTDGIVYELLRRLFHIGNFRFWVRFCKQLLLKNCTVDFVEICNVYTRKAIIKAAKRICNSDKICRSYCDFYFGVTFFGTQCITHTGGQSNVVQACDKVLVTIIYSKKIGMWNYFRYQTEQKSLTWCSWLAEVRCGSTPVIQDNMPKLSGKYFGR